MKTIALISTIILILSCVDKTTEIRYYPSDLELADTKTELVGLDTTKLNFRQMINLIRKDEGFEYDYGNTIMEFDDGKIKKRVIPYFFGSGHIKSKNILRITKDSILIDNGYSISELERILKRHYLNKGRIPFYSDLPSKAIVEVTIDTNSTGIDIKEVLTKLTRSFDEVYSEIKDTIELRVFFDNSREVPPTKID